MTAAFTQTEKRIALLIGNKDYKPGVGALTNPLNDMVERYKRSRAWEMVSKRSRYEYLRALTS